MESLSARRKRSAFKSLIFWVIKVVVFVVAWMIFLLPIAIIIGGLLFTMLEAALLDASGAEVAPDVASALALVGTAIIVAVIFIIIASVLGYFKRRSFIKTGRAVLLSTTWIGLLGVVSIAIINAPTVAPPVIDSVVEQPKVDVRTVAQDAELLTYAEQVGAMYLDNLELEFVDTYEQSDRVGQYQAFVNSNTGEFIRGELTVKLGMSESETRIAVAHEYLHHVWESQFDREKRDSLTSYLIALYSKDSYMQRQVQGYADSGMLLPTELFAFYCTGSSGEYLTDYVMETCNQYIDRSVLVMAR